MACNQATLGPFPDSVACKGLIRSYGRPMDDQPTQTPEPSKQGNELPQALTRALNQASADELRALRSALSRMDNRPWYGARPMLAALGFSLLLSAAAVTVALLAPIDWAGGRAGDTDRLAALERKFAAFDQSSAPAEDSQAGGFAELSASLERQATALQALRQDVENLQAAVSGTAPPETQTNTGSQTPPQASSQLSQRIDDLERSSITALGTLDEQLQAIAGDLAELRGQDAALANELENTRVALEAELVQWRERQTPPLWRMSAQLAGQTVRFSEGNRLADRAEAEALLRRIAAWLMEAGPEIGLRIVGYADIDGSGEPSNRITSQKRADAVRQMMLDLGIPGDRVVAVGRSTENRLVDDDSSGNANRRVAFEPFLRPEQTP